MTHKRALRSFLAVVESVSRRHAARPSSQARPGAPPRLGLPARPQRSCSGSPTPLPAAGLTPRFSNDQVFSSGRTTTLSTARSRLPSASFCRRGRPLSPDDRTGEPASSGCARRGTPARFCGRHTSRHAHRCSRLESCSRQCAKPRCRRPRRSPDACQSDTGCQCRDGGGSVPPAAGGAVIRWGHHVGLLLRIRVLFDMHIHTQGVARPTAKFRCHAVMRPDAGHSRPPRPVTDHAGLSRVQRALRRNGRSNGGAPALAGGLDVIGQRAQRADGHDSRLSQCRARDRPATPASAPGQTRLRAGGLEGQIIERLHLRDG